MSGDNGPPFNLTRRFAIVTLGTLLPIAALTGAVLARFVTEQALQRDAALTAGFIRNCVEVEGELIGARATGLAQFLDRAADPASGGVPPQAIATARAKVYKHLEALPGVLLATLSRPDGRIAWSTNKELVGSYAVENDDLRHAFASNTEVSRKHEGSEVDGYQQRLVIPAKKFFTETYVPLANAKGEVVMVAKVFKEPAHLPGDIRRGQLLVWSTTIAGGLLVWLGLFTIVGRASKLLRAQHVKLTDAESRIFLGDMATALAHSLRAPLASMRSSAELTLATKDGPARRNAHDIITQLDFLAGWVRELLQYSRPLAAQRESVDLSATLTRVLDSFATNFERAKVKVTWTPDPEWRPMVDGNATLTTQALHGVIANAIEAMPGGGELRLELRRRDEPPGAELIVSDTGVGMSAQQLARAFRPFHTTKSYGLGVGLPMLKGTMERFGGSVTLSSVEQGGTQVRLHFRS